LGIKMGRSKKRINENWELKWEGARKGQIKIGN
jgi:hypothetical protein